MNRRWGVPSLILEGVVQDKQRRVGDESRPLGVRDILSEKTPHLRPKSLPVLQQGLGEVPRFRRGGKQDVGKRRHRIGSTSRSRLLQSCLCGTKTWTREVASNNRLVDTQQVRRGPSVQIRNTEVRTSSSRKRRLDGLYRSTGRVLPDSRSQGLSEVPTIRMAQHSLLFKALCFGLSPAPQVFTRVFGVVAAHLHAQGVRLLRYLDDWLILGDSPESVARSLRTVSNLCDDLGVRINVKKSDWTPSQRTIYLGMVLDSRQFRASPSPERIERFEKLATLFLTEEVLTALRWEKILGMMSSMIHLIPGSRLRMRPLQFALKGQWHNKMSRFTSVTSNPQVREAVHWWLAVDRLSSGIDLTPVTPTVQLWTDASLAGWGGHTQTWQAAGRWSQSETALHINVLELRAMLRCLQLLPGLKRHDVVALQGDNTTALAYVKNLGGTQSPQCYKEARAIWLWAEEKEVKLVPRFIAGCLNVEADALSRKSLVVQSEWVLNSIVCRKLWALWGCPLVDLFATSRNNRLPLFFSPLPEASAMGTDAFLQSWAGMEVYAYPPTKVLRRLIQKLKASPGCVMTLIAPWWERQPWFPDLVDLSIEAPRALPLRKDLLAQTYDRHIFCHSLETLRLTAWRLSSTSTGEKGWIGRQPRSSPLVREILL